MTKARLYKKQLRAIQKGRRGMEIEALRGVNHAWNTDTCKICLSLPRNEDSFPRSTDCDMCPFSVICGKVFSYHSPCQAFASKYTVTEYTEDKETASLNNGLMASFLYSLELYMKENKQPIVKKMIEKRLK